MLRVLRCEIGVAATIRACNTIAWVIAFPSYSRNGTEWLCGFDILHFDRSSENNGVAVSLTGWELCKLMISSAAWTVRIDYINVSVTGILRSCLKTYKLFIAIAALWPCMHASFPLFSSWAGVIRVEIGNALRTGITSRCLCCPNSLCSRQTRTGIVLSLWQSA